MAKLFYLKEILSNPILVKGTTLQFENIGANRGVIALDSENTSDLPFIEALNGFAKRGVGGVIRISEADYTQKKMSPSPMPSVRPKEMLRARPTTPFDKPPQPPAPQPEGAAPVVPEQPASQPQPPADPLPEPPLDLSALTSDAPMVSIPESPAEPVADPAPPPVRPPTKRLSRKQQQQQ